MTQAQDEHREQPPTFGILAVPELRPGDYLATLHEWGALPEVIPVIEAARLLATLCEQNHAALRKIITDAIVADDIRFWGLSHSGEWREGMFRILHKPIGKPKIRPETNSRTAAVTLQFKTHGPLHVEAMGINPADVVKLLERRGRKVPHELLTLIQPAPAQATATPAPVEDVGATGEPTRPLPLTTGDIAFCFDGLHWDEDGWKKPLGDKPKWLEACIVIPGQRGVSAARWNPVLIGAELVKRKYAKLNSVRSKFQTKPLLTPWREEWKTYEADNFDKE